MSHRQAIDEYGRKRDKDVDNTVAAQDAHSSSSLSTPGVKSYSYAELQTAPIEIGERFNRGEEVCKKYEKDSSGNPKKTKYWVCCHRTNGTSKEYRLKDEEPEDWNEVQCNGEHEGHWVDEEDLLEW